jgi:hypothetical protein
VTQNILMVRAAKSKYTLSLQSTFLVIVCAILHTSDQQVLMKEAPSSRAIRSHQSEPRSCGTLNLTSKLTKHCFPANAALHAVCCVDIQLPTISNLSECNILERRIRAASLPASFSWCACTEQACVALGGRIAWILQPDGSTIRPLGAKPHDASAPIRKGAAAMELDDAAPPPPALANAIAAREAELRRLRSDTGTLRRDLLGDSESADEVRHTRRFYTRAKPLTVAL